MKATIHLQGIGTVPARPASDIRVGMFLSWNYAWKKCRVVSVRDVSSQFVEIDEEDVETGKVYRGRRLKKNRVVSLHEA